MKKYFVIILIALLTISLDSCGTYSTMESNKWLEYELAPSRITKNGEAFFDGVLSDGSNFSVFAETNIDNDASYFYVNLMQDFGWRKKDDKIWSAPQGSREYKLAHIYINPSRRAAIYFYPSGEYSAYKVNITKSENF